MDFLKWLFRSFINLDFILFGREHAKTLQGRLHYKKKIDLNNPKTLSDKIVWLEYNTDLTDKARLTDKIAVREFVESKGLGDLLVPIVAGPWRTLEDFDYDSLPKTFVMKPSHGAGGDVLICKDKINISSEYCKDKVSNWLKEECRGCNLEPHYKLIPHGVYCEELLDNPENLVDYKIFCINGNPWLILTCSNRSSINMTTSTKCLYDTDWNEVDSLLDKNGNERIDEPKNLNLMLEVARRLSEDFRFVRVDLYNIDGVVYFGEMTFTPNGGVQHVFTNHQELLGGELLDISDIF